MIVIVSLVSTVLVQGLGFGLSLYQQVESRREESHAEVLVRHWFGASSSALVVSVGEHSSLKGDSNHFSATSFNALVASSGIATPISWELIDDQKGSVLRYSQAGEAVLSWPIRRVHSFEYMDHDGGWHSSWPLQDQMALPLPAALRVIDATGSVYMLSVLQTRARPDLTVVRMHRDRASDF